MKGRTSRTSTSWSRPTPPTCPHRLYDDEELERLFPAMVVPDGVIEEEDGKDDAEEMLRLSEPIFRDIVDRAHHDGRLQRGRQ